MLGKNKKYHSYKLKDDTIEYEIGNLQEMNKEDADLLLQEKELAKKRQEVKEKIAEQEKRIIYLMETRNCNQVTVNRVTYILQNGQLLRRLSLDL